MEQFRIVLITIWPDQFSHAFTRHNAFLAGFTFLFCVGVYLSFTFVWSNFWYFRGIFRAQSIISDGALCEKNEELSSYEYLQKAPF